MKKLEYSEISGCFTWAFDPRGKPGLKGKKAGFLVNGYTLIKTTIGGKKASFFAHRLAWLYVYGEWPNSEIDHINGDRSDNRIQNLRDATHSENQQNRRAASKKSKTGVLGVHPTPDGRYVAQISINGRSVKIGRFRSVEDAQAAYIETKREIHAGCTI